MYYKSKENGDDTNIKVHKYTDILYTSGPVKVSDYISSKFSNIHEQLYNSALNKYVKSLGTTLDDFKNTYSIIELKQPEYTDASYILITEKKFPYKRSKVWLNSYWDTYNYKENTKDWTYLFADELSKTDAEIIDMNYATGRVVYKSRITGEIVTTDFAHINTDSKYGDAVKLTNTFTQLYQDKY